MSMSSEAVKRTARTALKDNYIKSMICCTVFVFAYLLSIYANSLFDFQICGCSCGVLYGICPYAQQITVLIQNRQFLQNL